MRAAFALLLRDDVWPFNLPSCKRMGSLANGQAIAVHIAGLRARCDGELERAETVQRAQARAVHAAHQHRFNQARVKSLVAWACHHGARAHYNSRRWCRAADLVKRLNGKQGMAPNTLRRYSLRCPRNGEHTDLVSDLRHACHCRRLTVGRRRQSMPARIPANTVAVPCTAFSRLSACGDAGSDAFLAPHSCKPFQSPASPAPCT